jgi:hypothetical protein
MELLAICTTTTTTTQPADHVSMAIFKKSTYYILRSHKFFLRLRLVTEIQFNFSNLRKKSSVEEKVLPDNGSCLYPCRIRR